VTNPKPTHNLCIIAKEEQKGGFQTIGIGWLNDKGAISIKLNKGVTLTWRDMEDHVLYLFAREDK